MVRRLSLVVLLLAAIVAWSTDRAAAQAPADANVIAPPAVPQAPFQLTPQEEQLLDQVLHEWETKSGQINTLQSNFTMFHYNAAFGPPPDPTTGEPRPLYINRGEVRFAKPDKGLYRITAMNKAKVENVAGGPPHVTHPPCNEEGEYWVCDGRAVYEKNAQKKQVIERPLPAELQGQAISEGPMPFVFGVQAAKLKQRYWLRVLAATKDQVRLEVFPKRQSDQANFQRALLILSGDELLPLAVRLFEPNGDLKTYVFEEPSKNGTVAQLQNVINWFVRPATPLGWQYLVEPMQAQAPPSNAGPQAALPGQPSPR